MVPAIVVAIAPAIVLAFGLVMVPEPHPRSGRERDSATFQGANRATRGRADGAPPGGAGGRARGEAALSIRRAGRQTTVSNLAAPCTGTRPVDARPRSRRPGGPGAPIGTPSQPVMPAPSSPEDPFRGSLLPESD